MDRVAEQTEQLGDMLEDSQESVSDFSTDSSLVSDDEVKSMIYGTSTAGAPATAPTSDKSIDDQLKELEKML